MDRGDVVTLKSGGVRMTVELMAGDKHYPNGVDSSQSITIGAGLVGCVWFDGNVLKRSSFPVSVLAKVDAEPVTIGQQRCAAVVYQAYRSEAGGQAVLIGPEFPKADDCVKAAERHASPGFEYWVNRQEVGKNDKTVWSRSKGWLT